MQYFGYLVTKRRLEEEDNFEDWVNRSSVSWNDAECLPVISLAI